MDPSLGTLAGSGGRAFGANASTASPRASSFGWGPFSLFHSFVPRNVPRGTFFGEWEGFGEACWNWLVCSDFQLRAFMSFCALLRRMGIPDPVAKVAGSERWTILR
jgi:hypothetical protein